MKIFLAAACSFLLPCFLPAQNCSGYYYMTNSTVEMTMYDGKARENGKVIYTNSAVKKSGSSTTANFNSEVFDKKGKSTAKGSGTYKCDNGALFLDARMSIPNEQTDAYKDMDVKAEESFIEYPSALSINQSLKDAHLKMKMYKRVEELHTQCHQK
ncbi:MAG: hypothetical protein EOO88_60620 [Pedobacter sp.]|nr:MAG: hypothetical protein EOO88_60620 [Pedobacter sp.]